MTFAALVPSFIISIYLAGMVRAQIKHNSTEIVRVERKGDEENKRIERKFEHEVGRLERTHSLHLESSTIVNAAIATMEANMSNIQSDVSEMKDDIKHILRNGSKEQSR